MSDGEFFQALLDEVLDMLAPLRQGLSDLDSFHALLIEHGWVPPTDETYKQALQEMLGQLVDFDALEAAAADLEVELSPAALESALRLLNGALGSLRKPDPGALAAALPEPLNDGAFWKIFLPELGDSLFVRWLQRRFPSIFAVLHLTGVVDIRRSVPQQVGRLPYLARRVRWSELGKVFSDPTAITRDTYQWGDTFDALLLLERLALALDALGLQPARRPADGPLLRRYWDGRTPPAPVELVEIPLLRDGLFDDALRVDLALEVIPVPGPAAPPTASWVGVAVAPIFSGVVSDSIGLTDSLSLLLAGGVRELTGPAVELRPATPPQLTLTGQLPSVELGIVLRGTPEDPYLLLGTRFGHRLELGSFEIGALFQDPATGDAEVRLRAALTGLRAVVLFRDSDGFLARIFGTSPQIFTLDTAVVWSSKSGLTFDAQASLRLLIPINRSLGPLELRTLEIVLGATASGEIRIQLAVGARAMLGPLAAAIEGVGVELRLKPDDARPTIGGLAATWAFKPPTGAGLALKAEVVAGGGYLFFDPEIEQYAGVLQLEVKRTIGLKAVGLITTRFPDGTRGFSLLIIISATFPAIQLGYGFTLNGAGGLLGLNRTMDIEALRSGVRNRALDSIMFPPDPVANAQRIISDLRAIFPPVASAFVIGPMARLGWGTPTLITIDLAILIELAVPLAITRIALLGRLSVNLPEPTAAVVSLNMAVAGTVDFTLGDAGVDATLYDSRIGVFTITGDMAMRLNWGSKPTFVLSAGGFHPRMAAPPDFPTLRRLTISLAESDNPRIRLDSYLAVTANTVQLGAKLDVFAAMDLGLLGNYTVAAYLGFDALVSLRPFSFEVVLDGGAVFKRNGEALCSATLQLTLTGPGRWHLWGEAVFEFLGTHRLPIEHSIGEEAASPPPEIVAVRQRLADAVKDPRSWSAELPADDQVLVTLRDSKPGDGELLIHPFGALTVRQRVVPLEVPIGRFGGTLPDHPGPYTISAHIGEQPAGGEVVRDAFAPGQYFALSDEQLLGRPAFEQLPAGFSGVRASAGRVVGSPRAVTFSYDSVVVDAPDIAGLDGLAAAELVALASLGAAGQALLRVEGSAAYRGGNTPLVTLREPTYTLADPDTLQRGGTYASYTEAEAARHTAGAAQVVGTHE